MTKIEEALRVLDLHFHSHNGQGLPECKCECCKSVKVLKSEWREKQIGWIKIEEDSKARASIDEYEITEKVVHAMLPPPLPEEE